MLRWLLSSSGSRQDEEEINADDDPYDPAKPEYLIPASVEEVEAGKLQLLQSQIACLEDSLSKRKETLDPQVAEHYTNILDEMYRSPIGRHVRTQSTPEGLTLLTSSSTTGHARSASEPPPRNESLLDRSIEDSLAPRKRSHDLGDDPDLFREWDKTDPIEVPSAGSHQGAIGNLESGSLVTSGEGSARWWAFWRQPDAVRRDAQRGPSVNQQEEVSEADQLNENEVSSEVEYDTNCDALKTAGSDAAASKAEVREETASALSSMWRISEALSLLGFVASSA